MSRCAAVANGESELVVDVKTSSLLTANQRLHWAEKARRTRELRQMFAALTRFTVKYQRAHILVDITWPDRRRRDAHNIVPTLKALIDGLVDIGLLPDDSDGHLVGPDLRVNPEPGKRGVVTLAFRIKEIA